MYTISSANENCFSKDARSNAPSVTSAHNCVNSYDVVFVTGIAAAVSVFLYALIGIISLGVMIHIIPSVIISAIIIMGIIINIYVIMRINKNQNNKAKQCFTQL